MNYKFLAYLFGVTFITMLILSNLSLSQRDIARRELQECKISQKTYVSIVELMKKQTLENVRNMEIK